MLMAAVALSAPATKPSGQHAGRNLRNGANDDSAALFVEVAANEEQLVSARRSASRER